MRSTKAGHVDLLNATPAEIQTFIDAETDPVVLGILVDLQAASAAGDDEEVVLCVERLFDACVLGRGVGL